LPRTGGCGGRRIAVITSYFSITCRNSIVHFLPFISNRQSQRMYRYEIGWISTYLPLFKRVSSSIVELLQFNVRIVVWTVFLRGRALCRMCCVDAIQREYCFTYCRAKQKCVAMQYLLFQTVKIWYAHYISIVRYPVRATGLMRCWVQPMEQCPMPSQSYWQDQSCLESCGTGILNDELSI
jgi:hypothetical protein